MRPQIRNRSKLLALQIRNSSKLLVLLIGNRWKLLALLIIVPAGFWTKFYEGPADSWVNNSLGGVLYVIFWCLLFSILVPKAGAVVISTAVLLVTSGLEFLQLWHPPILETVRSTFLGVTLIGNSFSWMDLLHYTAGAILAATLIHSLECLNASSRKKTVDR
jgi:hypothetical protein